MPKMQLSKIDKKIIKMLLVEENNKVKASHFSEILEIPRTTYQRRLKYLKNNYIRTYNDLNTNGLNFRRVDLLIGISKGSARRIGKELLKRDEVVVVSHRIGDANEVDLRAEVIIHDNLELCTYIEEIKSIDGVSSVRWSEIVEVLGRKQSVPDSIIDAL